MAAPETATFTRRKCLNNRGLMPPARRFLCESFPWLAHQILGPFSAAPIRTLNTAIHISLSVSVRPADGNSGNRGEASNEAL
jgi:hypothetical protein